MAKKKTILFIGAHNEEIEGSCPILPGKLAARGHRVVFLNPIGGWNWHFIRQMDSGAKDRLRKECLAAAEALGCEKVLWDYPCGETFNYRGEITKRMAQFVADIHPEFVFVHWPCDSHPDHRFIAQTTHHVLHFGRSLLEDPFQKFPAPEVFAFHAYYDQTFRFWPDFLILANDREMMKVKRSLACYKHGIYKDKWKHWWQHVQTINSQWTVRRPGEFAEPYKFIGPHLPIRGLRLAELLDREEIRPVANETWQFGKEFFDMTT